MLKYAVVVSKPIRLHVGSGYSDIGIERVEEAGKQKLIVRKFGLNKN